MIVHDMFNHADVPRIQKTLQHTKGLTCRQLEEHSDNCEACKITRAQRIHHGHRDSKAKSIADRRDPSLVAHLYSLDPENPLLGEVCQSGDAFSEGDTDEELCYVEEQVSNEGTLTAHTITQHREDTDYEYEEYDPEEEEDPDTHTFMANLIQDLHPHHEEWDSQEEEDPDECLIMNLEDHPRAAHYTGDYKEGGDDLQALEQTWTEEAYQAEIIGREYTKAIPRFDIQALRPFEVMFADNKDYDYTQRGGFKTALVIIDLKTLLKYKVDLTQKRDNGWAIQQFYVKFGVHKMPYKCTMYSDGCGSMVHLAKAGIRMGIDHCNLPPHDAALNLAEFAQRQMWEVARTLLARSGAPATLMAKAVEYAMYVDMRMATTSRIRGEITPYEAIQGHPPNISHLKPFYTKSYVTVAHAKRQLLKNRGMGEVRAETGRFLGFTDPFGGTYRILLDGYTSAQGSIKENRMVDSIAVKFDMYDYCIQQSANPGQGPTLPMSEQNQLNGLKCEADPNQDSQVSNGLNPGGIAHANEAFDPLRSYGDDSLQYSPITESPGSPNQVIQSRLVTHQPTYDGNRYVCDRECGYTARTLEEVLDHERGCYTSTMPHYNGKPWVCDWCDFDASTEGEVEEHQLNCSRGPTSPIPPKGMTQEERDEMYGTGTISLSPITVPTPIEKPEDPEAVSKDDFGTAANLALSIIKPTAKETAEAMERAIHKANQIYNVEAVPEQIDHAVIAEVAARIAQGAVKDIQWKQALQSPIREAAIAAYHKEITSLQKNILVEVFEGDPRFAQAQRDATTCRVLLDVKRNGTVKARAVKQGFKENKERADGVDFNYYSHVAKVASVRAVVLRPKRGERTLAVKDVSTAFLQSDRYEPGMTKFCSIKDPLTGKWHYYEQLGPIYGEASAPIRWERTLMPWLMEQGFTRGENEKSVLYHPTRDIVLLVYVDDVLADGFLPDIEWIFDLMDKRFECKDADYLTNTTPLDYIGIEIEKDDERIYMHMSKYIRNCVAALQLDDPSSITNPKSKKMVTSQRRYGTPIAIPIETEEPRLSPADHTYFLRGLGMMGWLANTARPDVAYAHSRIGQHAATPTQEAKIAVQRVFLYLRDHANLSLSVRIHDDVEIKKLYSPSQEHEVWKFYTDSDYAGNAETQNKRRSQNGSVFTSNDCPVQWSSKVSSVAFAHPLMKGAHADLSTGAVESYAAGNAAQDLLYFSYIVDECGIKGFPMPMKLLMDNEAARVFCMDTAFKTRMKHIDCRQEWVRTLRDRGIITPVHVPTADNLADLFTKILSEPVFTLLRNRMMIPCTLE